MKNKCIYSELINGDMACTHCGDYDWDKNSCDKENVQFKEENNDTEN